MSVAAKGDIEDARSVDTKETVETGLVEEDHIGRARSRQRSRCEIHILLVSVVAISDTIEVSGARRLVQCAVVLAMVGQLLDQGERITLDNGIGQNEFLVGVEEMRT